MSDKDPASPVVKKPPKINRTKKTPKAASNPIPEGVTEVQPKASKTEKKPVKGLDAHGFRVGSDSSKIVEIMLAGGLDRQDINDKVAAAIDPLTRNGRRKNIPSLISGLISRLEARDYEQVSHWKLVAPKKKR